MRREPCPATSEFTGIDGLEDALLRRPELFVATLTENLLTFALGRGVEYYDAPAVRKIVSDAEKDGYRFSSLILGIVKSVPFQMRRAEMTPVAGNRRSSGECQVEGERDVSDEEGDSQADVPEEARRRALALPLLDAMIPAATAWAKTPAKPVPRLGFVFIPMGCDQARWTPPGQGKLDELSPILAPLKPVKDQVTVITNTAAAERLSGHARHLQLGVSERGDFAKHTESSDYYLGTTVDQIAAKQMGRDTQLASLQLPMDLNPLAGVCNNGYACVYQNCLSWSSPTTPLPSEAHPRVVFERLFGEGGNAAARRAALHNRASLLDSFTTDIARLKQRVGAPDRVRLDQYLDSVRQVEREIERAEKAVADNKTPDLDRPVGVPAAFADHAKLMFDLQILAFQADITRVVTFQLTREQSNRTYPEIGVPDPHHPTSHHGNDPEK